MTRGTVPVSAPSLLQLRVYDRAQHRALHPVSVLRGKRRISRGIPNEGPEEYELDPERSNWPDQLPPRAVSGHARPSPAVEGNPSPDAGLFSDIDLEEVETRTRNGICLCVL
ncbi:hypothetical protein EYF80_045244 [Liparis tanakae]|uniref:Uncharacterized protein n=1 Tax=Liparis tanakae TaxID=230148 RepID=A0A4Z2FUK2_9TELE|nr:hypothetical protein EYF80_045244 [Liparis tanakae]